MLVGSDSGMFLGYNEIFRENFSEITAVSKTACGADGGDRQIRINQQVTGTTEAVIGQIRERCLTEIIVETAAAFTDADKAGIRNLFQGQFFLVMVCDKGHHELDTFITGDGFGRQFKIG